MNPLMDCNSDDLDLPNNYTMYNYHTLNYLSRNVVIFRSYL